MLLYIGLTFCIVLVAKCSELVTFQEAAFQGKSPTHPCFTGNGVELDFCSRTMRQKFIR